MSARRQELAAKMRADYKPLDPAKMTPKKNLDSSETDSFSLVVKVVNGLPINLYTNKIHNF